MIARVAVVRAYDDQGSLGFGASNGFTLTGANRTPNSIALGTAALRLASGAALSWAITPPTDQVFDCHLDSSITVVMMFSSARDHAHDETRSEQKGEVRDETSAGVAERLDCGTRR